MSNPGQVSASCARQTGPVVTIIRCSKLNAVPIRGTNIRNLICKNSRERQSSARFQALANECCVVDQRTGQNVGNDEIKLIVKLIDLHGGLEPVTNFVTERILPGRRYRLQIDR